MSPKYDFFLFANKGGGDITSLVLSGGGPDPLGPPWLKTMLNIMHGKQLYLSDRHQILTYNGGLHTERTKYL